MINDKTETMSELTIIAKEYASFFANRGEACVIAGDGAEMLADAIVEEITFEQDIVVIAVDDEIGWDILNDWIKMAHTKNLTVVFVISERQEHTHLQGRIGTMLERSASNIIICNTAGQGKLHVADFKNHRDKEPLDRVINL